MRTVLMILALLGSMVTWICAAVQWFQHDDHAALGLFALSLSLGAYGSGFIINAYRSRA